MDRRAAAGGLGVDLGELVAGASQADLEALDLAEPASRSASAIRACRLSLISASRGRWAGSGRRSAHRTHACSWMQGVPKARAQMPTDSLRRSKWPRKASHSALVGVWYSSAGRWSRRRARKARCASNFLSECPSDGKRLRPTYEGHRSPVPLITPPASSGRRPRHSPRRSTPHRPTRHCFLTLNQTLFFRVKVAG